MSLKRLVKLTKLRGSKVYGVVELSMLGKATIKLVGSSQRLTNLPIFGENVLTGDMVIIDYSAEGRPYVRMAIPQVERSAPPIDIIDKGTGAGAEDGFVAGKVMLTGNTTFTDTVAGDTITWIPINFDLLLYDTDDIWNNGKFGPLKIGQYLASVSLGFRSLTTEGTGWYAVQLLNYKHSEDTITPIDFKIPFSKRVQFYGGGGDHNIHVANFSTLCRISEHDQAIGLALAVQTAEYIECEILQLYSWFSIHKLKNLAGDNAQAVRGYWDSGGSYF
jgi:hypothetical protein